MCIIGYWGHGSNRTDNSLNNMYITWNDPSQDDDKHEHW